MSSLERYSRQMRFYGVGEAGQKKIVASRVALCGCGALGTVLANVLVRAGVGFVRVIDRDFVETSNLQRQVLFDTSVVGQSKAVVAAARLRALNPYIEIETFAERFDETNADRMLSGFGAIMDGTDNFATRYLVNDVAVKQGKPNFFGCIFRFSGQLSVFTGETGCYRCLFPAPPAPELAPDCAQAGVLGVLPGLVGTYQALEFLKWQLGIGTSLAGKLLTIETMASQFRTLKYAKNPSCPACSNPSAIKLEGYQAACASGPAGDAPITNITVAELKTRLAARDVVLIDVRNAVEHDIGNIGGTLIPVDVIAQQTTETIQSLVPADRDQPIAIYCRSGARSARACQLLQQLGYTRVINVQGGIVAWQRDIDPSVRI